jgi:general secretion pathway protein K
MRHCKKASNSPGHKRIQNNRGIALVLTLMVVSIITAMVVEFAYGVYVSTSALHNWQVSQELSLAADSATRLGARLVSEKAGLLSYTPPRAVEIAQKIPFEEIDGTIAIRIEDENARFNVNNLVYTTGGPNTDAIAAFVRLLKALDLRPDIADRVVDWIDADSIPRIADSENLAKNAKLDSIDELLLIPGIDEDAFERLRPYVTIYGNNLIDINTAEVPVIMSLSDKIDKAMAANVVEYRERTPFQTPTEILQVGGFQSILGIQGYISVKSNTYRIVATASSGDIKRIIESVMDIAGPTKIVKYWREY